MDFDLVPADTTLDAARVEAEIYRRMPAARRLRLACEMSDYVRALSVAGVRRQHAEYSEEEAKLAVTGMCIGEKLFKEVYPGRDVRP
jgi:hypothetical protein